MRKIVSLLLVLVVVLGCVGLAACGGGDGGAVVDNGDSQPANGDGNGDGTGDGNGAGNGGGNGGGESLGDILGHGAGIDSVSYTMETSGSGIPTMTTQMWVEGNKMKLEMDEMGQHIIYLSDYDAGTAYMYMPEENIAIQMDISQIPPPDYEGVQDIPDYHPTVIGTQTMDGKVCLVVEYSYGGATVKSWIWKEHGFPIRTETTTAEGTVIIVFKDIYFGDINDNLFELPPGVQIMSQ